MQQVFIPRRVNIFSLPTDFFYQKDTQIYCSVSLIILTLARIIFLAFLQFILCLSLLKSHFYFCQTFEGED